MPTIPKTKEDVCLAIVLAWTLTSIAYLAFHIYRTASSLI